MLHLGRVLLKRRKNYSRDPILSCWAKKLVNTVVLNVSNDVFPRINGNNTPLVSLSSLEHTWKDRESENCCHSYLYLFCSDWCSAAQTSTPSAKLELSFFFPNLAAQMHIPSHELVSGLLPLACSALYEWLAPFSKNMRTSLCKHSELPNIPPTWVILGSKYKAMTLPALTVALKKVTAMNKSPRETYSGCHHS